MRPSLWLLSTRLASLIALTAASVVGVAACEQDTGLTREDLRALAVCGRAVERCGGQVGLAQICDNSPVCKVGKARIRCGEECHFPAAATFTADLSDALLTKHQDTIFFLPTTARSSAEALRMFDVRLDGIDAVPTSRLGELAFPGHEGPLRLLEVTGKFGTGEDPGGAQVLIEDADCVDAAFDDPKVCPDI